VVAAVEVAQLDTDAETEPASATPTVITSTAVMMVVEDLAVLAKTELSAKVPLIFILNNATSTVTLKSELKSENSRLLTSSVRLAVLMSQDPTLSLLPTKSTLDPILDTSLLMFPLESMELIHSTLTVLDIKLMLRPMPSTFLDNWLPSLLIGTQFKLKSEMRPPTNCCHQPPFKFLELHTV
jgi:hypothetical protein